MHSSLRTTFALLCTLGTTILVGCSSKHTGAGTLDTQGRNVDPSWVTAAQTCWPDLSRQGYSVDAIKRDLADAASFRNAFPVYTAQPEANIRALLEKPLQTAPPPDVSKLTHSQTPVITRGQAGAGTGLGDAAVASTNGIAPPDGLCSLQPGAPVGFTK